MALSEKKKERLNNLLRNSAIIILLLLLVAVLLFDRVFIKIRSGEVGVLYKLVDGTVTDDHYGEGLQVIAPYNTMFIYNVREQIVSKHMDVLSKDGMYIQIDVAIRFHPIIDSIGALHQRLGPNYIDKVLLPEVESSTRKIIAQYDPHLLYTIARDTIEQQIVNDSKREFGNMHVQVEDIMLKSIRLPDAITTAIESKLAQEQANLEYNYRLLKEEKEAQRKLIEARGIKSFRDTSGISILKWKGIEATTELAKSPNSKIILIGNESKDLPVILNADPNTP